MRFLPLFLAIWLSAVLSSQAQTTSLSIGTEAQWPKHEVRAVWLTVVQGLDWPRTTNEEAQRRDMRQILDKLQQAGINTVLLQARVRATTIYPSELEPWEGGFTGTPGKAPKYDPLQFCIDECHKRGMECHAWVVTIPIGKTNRIGAQQMRKKHPQMVKRIGDESYMDPTNPQTATYLANICREIVKNYDVDGIHLDYIRYPETWAKPKKAGENAARRRQITGIVKAISKAVKEQKPWVKMSCSPVGKYADLTRYRAGGWNARDAVAQEAQLWLRDGLMDELFPMMYFKDDNFYPFAIDWQEQSHGRIVCPGLGIYFLDPREGKWTLDIVEREMNVLRQLGMGHCYFRSKFFTDNVKGVYDMGARFDQVPALVPPMTWMDKPAPTAPQTVQINGDTLSWSGAQTRNDSPDLHYNVYASADFPVDITKATNLVATRIAATSLLVPATGVNYAVTATDRYGQESHAIQLQLIAAPQYAMAPIIAKTDGRAIALPDKGSTLDADFVVVETMSGRQMGVFPYTRTLNVSTLPDGLYQLRSLGRKGRNHRIGFFAIKR